MGRVMENEKREGRERLLGNDNKKREEAKGFSSEPLLPHFEGRSNEKGAPFSFFSPKRGKNG